MNSSQLETLDVTASVLKVVIYTMAAHAKLDFVMLGRHFKQAGDSDQMHPAAAEILDHIGDTLISSTGLPPI
jgi:uncharacterized protein (DUF1800 family)